MNIVRTLIVGLATLGLGACVTPMQKHIADRTDSYAKDGATAAQTLRDHPEGFLQEEETLWVGGDPVPMQALNALPKIFDGPANFHASEPITLQRAAQIITSKSHLAVRVAADAAEEAVKTVTEPVSAGSVSAIPGGFTLHYDGTLRGLFDELASRTGNTWAWREGAVSIFHNDTRTFFINALPGKTSYQESVTNKASSGGSGGGGGGSGGGTSAQTEISAGQTATVQSETEIFKSVSDSVKSMLSKGGGLSVSEATNTVSVTDTPDVLDRVGEFVATINKRLTRQVVIDVRVYNVELKDGESYGIDWTGVFNTLTSKYGVTAHSISDAASDAATLGIAVVRPTSPAYGTNVLLSALSTQGNLGELTSTAQVTLSGQPVPVQVTSENGYVASVQSTLVSNAGTQTSATLGSVTTGFSMNVLPIVLDNNDVIMQVSMQLSALRELRRIATGSTTLEAPSIDSRDFMQRVLLHSGSSLVLSGFEQDRVQSDLRGVGSAHFALAGGGANGSKGRTVLVVILTPKVV